VLVANQKSSRVLAGDQSQNSEQKQNACMGRTHCLCSHIRGLYAGVADWPDHSRRTRSTAHRVDSNRRKPMNDGALILHAKGVTGHGEEAFQHGRCIRSYIEEPRLLLLGIAQARAPPLSISTNQQHPRALPLYAVTGSSALRGVGSLRRPSKCM
jgi:hypothetical protein